MQILCKYAFGAGIFAAGCMVGYLVGRLSARKGGGLRPGPYDGILRDILEQRKVPLPDIDSAIPLTKAEIRNGRSLSDSRMSAVFRIECVFTKADHHKYGVETLVYEPGTDGGTERITRIRKTIGWEYLPSDVRATFIRDRGERVTVLIYDRKVHSHA